MRQRLSLIRHFPILILLAATLPAHPAAGRPPGSINEVIANRIATNCHCVESSAGWDLWGTPTPGMGPPGPRDRQALPITGPFGKLEECLGGGRIACGRGAGVLCVFLADRPRKRGCTHPPSALRR